jgi:hypothetical protein
LTFHFAARIFLIVLLLGITSLKPEAQGRCPVPDGVKVKHQFYVSPTGNDSNSGSRKLPFATIGRARDAIRTVRCGITKDVTVYLRGGTYAVQSPLIFNELDSGVDGFNITYQNYEGEYVEVNGGYQIYNWQQVPGTAIWTAQTPPIQFRQLYVNRVWQPRARTANFNAVDWHLKNGNWRGFVIDPNQFPHPASMLDDKSVQFRLQQEWRDFHLPVDKIITRSDGRYAVLLEEPYFGESFSLIGPAFALPQLTSTMFLENDLSFLDTPGEWYHNRQTNELFYMPARDVDMNTAVVFVPLADELLRIEGSSVDQKVHHLRFTGIHWNHAGKWLAPDTEGSLTVQAQWYKRPTVAPRTIVAAIVINNAHDILFADNTVEGMGSVGLWAGWAVERLRITGNVFKHIGDSAIVIGHPENKGIDLNGGFNPALLPSRVTIASNLISEIAKDFWGSPGITVYYASHTRIKQNDLSLMPYSGISLGWGWSEPQNLLFKNKIVKNKIHHVMGTLKDGGAIYTLGNSQASVISGNYIEYQYNDHGGIYLDEGSTNWKVKQNVVEFAPQWIYMWTSSIQNNYIDSNWTNTNSMTDNGQNNVVTNTYIISEENENNPQFQKIKTEAGLPAAYSHLLRKLWMKDNRSLEGDTRVIGLPES